MQRMTWISARPSPTPQATPSAAVPPATVYREYPTKHPARCTRSDRECALPRPSMISSSPRSCFPCGTCRRGYRRKAGGARGGRVARRRRRAGTLRSDPDRPDRCSRSWRGFDRRSMARLVSLCGRLGGVPETDVAAAGHSPGPAVRRRRSARAGAAGRRSARPRLARAAAARSGSRTIRGWWMTRVSAMMSPTRCRRRLKQRHRHQRQDPDEDEEPFDGAGPLPKRKVSRAGRPPSPSSDCAPPPVGRQAAARCGDHAEAADALADRLAVPDQLAGHIIGRPNEEEEERNDDSERRSASSPTSSIRRTISDGGPSVSSTSMICAASRAPRPATSKWSGTPSGGTISASRR